MMRLSCDAHHVTNSFFKDDYDSKRRGRSNCDLSMQFSLPECSSVRATACHSTQALPVESPEGGAANQPGDGTVAAIQQFASIPCCEGFSSGGPGFGDRIRGCGE